MGNHRIDASILALLTVLLATLLAGCAQWSPKPGDSKVQLPKPLREGARATAAETEQAPVEAAVQQPEFTPTPVVKVGGGGVAGAEGEAMPDLPESGEGLVVNVQDMTLAAFINEVYGNLLKLDFQVAQAITELKDLVTFRLSTPQSPAAVYDAAGQVLERYGVVARVQDGRLMFEQATGAASVEPPLIVSGRALPEVPVSHRPVFQIVPLKVVRVGSVAVWLRAAFDQQNLTVLEDQSRNLMILSGKQSAVKQALAAVDFLDQPAMRGKHSFKATPLYWSALEMAGKLKEVLSTEGYEVDTAASSGGIVLLPVAQSNSILVFAPEQKLLGHIREWIANLDVPPRQRYQSGFYSYQVRNTSASSMVKVLENFTSEVAAAAPQAESGQAQEAVKPKTQLVVDEARNALVFYGQTDVWMQMLPVIREMDKADRMALIEVTIAEIKLTDQNQFGIEWLALGKGINGEDAIISTTGGLGLKQGGLSYILNSAGQTRAVLKAFASTNGVNVISTPRLMAQSGYAASIDVGDEVPLITSQAQSDVQQGGDSAILQEVQYQKTGVSLTITPVIFSDNKISLEIKQSVSDALANETSSIDSPVIQNREVSTAVTLEDGGSVLVAGLISSTNTSGKSRVPGFGDIPVLGKLFSTNSETNVKTELVILVVPYIINSQGDAEAISELFQQRLDWTF